MQWKALRVVLNPKKEEASGTWKPRRQDPFGFCKVCHTCSKKWKKTVGFVPPAHPAGSALSGEGGSGRNDPLH